MKWRTLATLVACILILSIASVAFAAPRPPSADSWVDASSNNYGTQTTVKVQSSNVSACTPSWYSYMKWELASVNQAVGTVNLHVTSRFSSWSQPITLSLFAAANDSWTETGISGTGQPGTTGGALSTLQISALPAAGTVLTFPSTPDLVNFINAQRPGVGDGVASLVIQLTGCGTGQSRIDLDSREGTVPEDLELLGTTAVTMSTASAQQQTSWPLYGGLAAVALLVVAGVTISRRRTA